MTLTMMYLYKQNILIGAIVIVIMMTGCALPPAITFLSGAKTTWDIAAILRDEKTINDHIISDISKRECKTRNIFKDQEYCERTLKEKLKEYIKELTDAERKLK